jgi:hypothetical protein
MSTIRSIDAWLTRLERKDRERRDWEARAAEAARLLRDGDPADRTWLHPGPDGRLRLMRWTPQMGPWEVLSAKIDAAEDAAHGHPHRRADGSLATLPQLMAEIEQLLHGADRTETNGKGSDG